MQQVIKLSKRVLNLSLVAEADWDSKEGGYVCFRWAVPNKDGSGLMSDALYKQDAHLFWKAFTGEEPPRA